MFLEVIWTKTCSRWFSSALVSLMLLASARADIVINEFLANNQSGLRDADSEFSDWIELYNSGTSSVSLQGYTLTDDPANPTKWVFPEVFLNRGAYLIVFASGKDRRNPSAALHTNFSLDSNGEYLALFEPESSTPATEFAPTFPPQQRDISFGPRAGRNYFFSPPSPNAPNTGGFADFVADTKFSHDRGFYDAPFNLTISTATPGVIIRYTLDGTIPTLTAGQTYTAPLSISKTTAVRAAAFKEGYQPSNVDTHTYVFVNDVIRQSPNGETPQGWPSSWGSNTKDYGMDPDVVDSSLYKDTIKNDLKTLPSFCVTLKLGDLFDSSTGIYANPGQDGRAWERPCSLELVYPDGTQGFQINAGIRIRGGFSRSTSNPKHAFRFFFREQYGAGKLRYPLFGDGGTDTFDGIDLRTFQNYSWSFQGDSQGVFMRDQFSRDTQLDMGQPAERGNYYHLYINGQYWGLFNTCERPEASYGETYIGGAKEDYDTIKVEAGPYTIFATDGTMAAWTKIYNDLKTTPVTDETYFRLQGLNLDGSTNSSYPPYLDVDNLIDYMLVIIYGGNLDAPISNFLGNTSPNNWFGIWNRTGQFGGFRFFAHDAEHTLLDVNQDRTGPFSAGDSSITKSNPQWFWQQLASNSEFRVRVADRIHRHFFNNGALTPAAARARFLKRKDQIDRAVVAESARWGDSKRSTPFTRDNAWLPSVNRILNNYLPQRSAIVLTQLRNYRAAGQARPLYPSLAAPSFSQFGGTLNPGTTVSLTAPQGQIYYTTDGSDPRRRGGSQAPTARLYNAPIPVAEATQLRCRTKNGTDWSAIAEATFVVNQDFAGLKLTEIMYNPPARDGVDGDEFEFLELKNAGTVDLDLSNLQFTNGVTFKFPLGSRLAAGRFLLLAANATALSTKYPGVKVFGSYEGRLSNGGERLALAQADGRSLFNFAFSDTAPWPQAADGIGFSLVPVLPNSNPDPSNATHWRASSSIGGSPGSDDNALAITPVVINEVLTHTDPPLLDSIELHNPGNTTADLSGWWLSDDWAQPKKFRIPSNTRLQPGTYWVLDESAFNQPALGTNAFSLNSHGDELILSSANANGELTGYVDALRLDAAPNGVSFGRITNSVREIQFPLLASRTLGSINAPPAPAPVVLNEILYAPLLGDVEFVELRNVSDQPVPLFDPNNPANTWSLNGIDFVFPTGVTLPPSGIAVIASGDPIAFRQLFSIPSEVPVFGPFNGSLQDGGETLSLLRPDAPDRITNGVVVTTVVPQIVVDSARYESTAPWPPTAGTAGASLERKMPPTYGNDPASWQASVLFPSPGATIDSNRTPRINAGPDTEFISQSYPLSVPISGTAFDDGRPNPPGRLSYQWTQVAGPGVVVFSDPSLLATSAFIPGQGTYTLRLTANDGERSSSDEILITTRRQEGLTTLVPLGSTWRYLDSGSDPGTAWRAKNFDDASWKSGPAQLGYSAGEEGDEKTLLSFGDSSSNKRIAYYFRLAFNLSNVASVTELVGRLIRDDGAVVWLNGNEAYRENMPEGDPTFTTRANATVGGADESTVFERPIDSGLLAEGRNVLAIEVHQTSPTSSDISFDFSLAGRIASINAAPTANSGPDLSIQLPESAPLNASFTDDGLPATPGAPVFSWSKISGPGTVQFNPPDSPRTRASFSTTGNYVLRFTVQDGAMTASDDVRISALPGNPVVAPGLTILPGTPAKLQISTAAGQSYTVQYLETLRSGDWKTWRNVTADASGTVELSIDTVASETRFFRVRSP